MAIASTNDTAGLYYDDWPDWRNDYTVMCWVYINADATGTTNVVYQFRKKAESGDSEYLRVYYNPGGNHFKLRGDDGSGDQNLTESTGGRDIGEWFHVALTFDTAGTDTAKMYVDAVEEISMDIDHSTSSTDWWFSVGVHIQGTSIDSATLAFASDMHYWDMKIWEGVVMTPQQIRSEMDYGRPRMAGAGAWLPMLESGGGLEHGDTVEDWSGNGNVLTTVLQEAELGDGIRRTPLEWNDHLWVPTAAAPPSTTKRYLIT